MKDAVPGNRWPGPDDALSWEAQHCKSGLECRIVSLQDGWLLYGGLTGSMISRSSSSVMTCLRWMYLHAMHCQGVRCLKEQVGQQYSLEGQALGHYPLSLNNCF